MILEKCFDHGFDKIKVVPEQLAIRVCECPCGSMTVANAERSKLKQAAPPLPAEAAVARQKHLEKVPDDFLADESGFGSNTDDGTDDREAGPATKQAGVARDIELVPTAFQS